MKTLLFTNYTVALVFISAVLLLPGCSSEYPTNASDPWPRTEPDAQSIVKSYAQLRPMTDGPVPGDPAIAVLCVTIGPEQLEAARRAYGPHARAMVSIYMNETAASAYERGTPYPPGAVVVKEKHSFISESGVSDEGIGGMIKRPPGYNTEHGDWEYFYQDPSTPLQTGRLPSCIDCHQGAAKNDFVFGGWGEP